MVSQASEMPSPNGAKTTRPVAIPSLRCWAADRPNNWWVYGNKLLERVSHCRGLITTLFLSIADPFAYPHRTRTRRAAAPPSRPTARAATPIRRWPRRPSRFSPACSWATRRTRQTRAPCNATTSSTCWTWRQTCRTCLRRPATFGTCRSPSPTTGRRIWPATFRWRSTLLVSDLIYYLIWVEAK